MQEIRTSGLMRKSHRRQRRGDESLLYNGKRSARSSPWAAMVLLALKMRVPSATACRHSSATGWRTTRRQSRRGSIPARPASTAAERHYRISGSSASARTPSAARPLLGRPPRAGVGLPDGPSKGYVGGSDRRIALTGGIWDMANLDQSANPSGSGTAPPRERPAAEARERLLLRHGDALLRVEGMTVRGLTIRNPTSYGLAFCRMSYFLVDDLTFDYTTCNPIFLNMDVHLDSWCTRKISNLRGTCFDDMVALNANDGQCAQEEGDITDIDIDGIYADYCHSAVRLLDGRKPEARDDPQRPQELLHVHGGPGPHFFRNRKTRGVFDDIVIATPSRRRRSRRENVGVHSRASHSSGSRARWTRRAAHGRGPQPRREDRSRRDAPD